MKIAESHRRGKGWAGKLEQPAKSRLHWRSLKKYPCKKNKGEHEITLVETRRRFMYVYDLLQCQVCGKHFFRHWVKIPPQKQELPTIRLDEL